jgi:hypothetical protein
MSLTQTQIERKFYNLYLFALELGGHSDAIEVAQEIIEKKYGVVLGKTECRDVIRLERVS